MKVLSDNKLTGAEYAAWLSEHVKMLWKECMQEEHGPWDNQSQESKDYFYEEVFRANRDMLGKCCCDCAYVGVTKKERYYCNCGDSENYEKTITARNYCDAFEEL